MLYDLASLLYGYFDIDGIQEMSIVFDPLFVNYLKINQFKSYFFCVYQNYPKRNYTSWLKSQNTSQFKLHEAF